MFEPTDPLVCHSLQLRPSLWAVVFNSLQQLGAEWSWRQDDPASATVEEVILEIQKATDNAIFSGCMMIGQVIELSTDLIPAWCLLCDGTTYADADYPELGAVIHAGLRVDATHFRVPQRENRFGMGGAMVGTQGGEENHTLTFSELPPQATDVAFDFIEAAAGAGAFALYDINGNGGGQPHNNMPPFEETQFVIIAKYPSAG